MSENNGQKIKIKEESQSVNNLSENANQNINTKKESSKPLIEQLIIKLIKQSLSNSLSNLESSHKKQDDTLKIIAKDSKDNISKLLKLTKEVRENTIKEELKKGKLKLNEKENIKKLAITQSNFRPKDEKVLIKNKIKKLNKDKDKDINNKTHTRFNTLNNSKILDDKPKHNRIKSIKDIANKTQINFRNNKTSIPSNQINKRDKKIEIINNNKNKNNKSNLELKEKVEKNKTINNRLTNFNTKKIISKNKSHINNKLISKSFSKNPLENSSEKVEEKDIKRTKSKFPNLRKDIKGALFKNIKKEFNKLDKQLNVIEENDSKNNKNKLDKKENKNISPDKKIKEQEETIQKQQEKIFKLSEELRNYKKDNRKGIYIIKQDKNVHISKKLIKIEDEFVILIKTEPLSYYDSVYYLLDYEIDKIKSKEIYVDNKKLNENEYSISDKYNLEINYPNTYNDETRKIKVILEISNELLNYSNYDLSFNKTDVLLKYEINADNDIQIDDVTNEYFKINKTANWVLFEGKTTNEIIVKPGSVIYSKKINYQIYKYIPEFKSKENDIIKLKDAYNNIGFNILAKYIKFNITKYGQEVEELYKIKVLNYPSRNYILNFNHGLLLDTKYEIELVELNGEKAEYLDENSVIKIKNFGAFNNQFAEIHLKYKYFKKEKNDINRIESMVVSNIKNTYCKFIISIPEDYVVLQTNDIFPVSQSNKNEYIFDGISKEDTLKEYVKFSTKKGEWDIQKEITLEGEKNIEKCNFKIDRIFKGGNLEIVSYEIIKENAEFVEDIEQNKFIFDYKNLNTNKVKIQWNIKAKNSTTNYIFDGNNDLIIKIPKEDEIFFKELSNKILEEDNSNFPLYKKLGKWVYNYMTYNLSYLGRKLTAKQIYDKKMGVCEHYSLLYNTLLTAQGIKVVKVSGYALANNRIGNNDNDISIQNNNENDLSDRRHAWSLAFIDGNWIPLDATWNLFEKNVPLTHIFQNYGDSTNNTTGYIGNNINSEITKEIIKQI